MVWDCLLDALIDCAKILPFLFAAYLLIEILEKKAEEGSVRLVEKAGKWGPVLGGALGIVPQCGFSAATANLYACGVVTKGTLLAVFLSTSDEMLPILISQNVGAGLILKVLAVKVAVAVVVGLAVDGVLRLLGKHPTEHIHDICEQEGCRCEDGVLKSALRHTLRIILFLLLVTFLLNLAVEALGEERLSSFALNRPFLGELLAGLIGLIPNCAGSVILTQLYLSGGMRAGGLLAGLLVSSGVGILVLFRMHRNLRDNLVTLAILYLSGVLGGWALGSLPIF